MEKVLELIEKHKKLNKLHGMSELVRYKVTGEEEALHTYHAHAGAITGLEILRRELEGGEEY